MALSNIESDTLAFQQGLEAAVASDGSEMSKNVRTRILGDETIAFGFVEPFHSSCNTRHNEFKSKWLTLEYSWPVSLDLLM